MTFQMFRIHLVTWTNTFCNVVWQKVQGSVFATRESVLEARRRSRGGGEVKAERPQGGTGRDTEWSRGGKRRGRQRIITTQERGRMAAMIHTLN